MAGCVWRHQRRFDADGGDGVGSLRLVGVVEPGAGGISLAVTMGWSLALAESARR
ncbi:MAG: hypothetical protein MR006_04455 [Arcanobacterium sp.]|nr:hypothetical protein [Arcanobacterium sp.]MDY5589695.1 hypothetical protein [Arcanobacterium sp.]